jgi:hypothetical protein
MALRLRISSLTTETSQSVQITPWTRHLSSDAISADQHTSPCLAVNPRDPRNLLAACMLTSGNVATYALFDGGGNWDSTGRSRSVQAGPIRL